MLLLVESLKRVAPAWLKISFDLKRDAEADAEFGWMLEMWGYSIACAKDGLRHRLPDNTAPGALQLEPSSQFGTVITARDRAHPSAPALPTAYLYHYTFAHEYSEEGVPQFDSKHGEWSFDKRNFQRYLPRSLLPPPRCALESAHVRCAALQPHAPGRRPRLQHRAPPGCNTACPRLQHRVTPGCNTACPRLQHCVPPGALHSAARRQHQPRTVTAGRALALRPQAPRHHRPCRRLGTRAARQSGARREPPCNPARPSLQPYGGTPATLGARLPDGSDGSARCGAAAADHP